MPGRVAEAVDQEPVEDREADPGPLERVVANLVANARAASPPGRPVRLHGRCLGEHVQLHVVDHGPGIPEAARERMFEPFQRLDDRATTAGLGLGLAIARGFAEAMDATLTPSDTPGGGLTMTLDLPLARAGDTDTGWACRSRPLGGDR